MKISKCSSANWHVVLDGVTALLNQNTSDIDSFHMNEQVHFISWFPILVDMGGNNVFLKTINEKPSYDRNSGY